MSSINKLVVMLGQERNIKTELKVGDKVVCVSPNRRSDLPEHLQPPPHRKPYPVSKLVGGRKPRVVLDDGSSVLNQDGELTSYHYKWAEPYDAQVEAEHAARVQRYEEAEKLVIKIGRIEPNQWLEILLVPGGTLGTLLKEYVINWLAIERITNPK